MQTAMLDAIAVIFLNKMWQKMFQTRRNNLVIKELKD
jgi:hypothetical protein